VKRILFVDDERPVLDGLRLRLHRMHTKWQMDFVESGVLAIEAMRERPYDMIVTDMRMQGMDGGKLLAAVQESWPQTVRIILSGYVEIDEITRLVPIAHQYLSKPCPPEVLENVIERCLGLQELLQRPQLRAVVGRIRQLPSLPGIYVKLQGIVTDEHMTLTDVAKIVAADSALAARVLQIVNSAFFRLARRISSIEQAVGHLGFKTIRNLAMSVEIFSRWPSSACAGVDLGKMQQHVHAVATAVGTLVGPRHADDAMLAGLLHDIGYWVLAQECPQEVAKSIELAVHEQIPLHAAETSVIGASHAEIGAYLLGIWGLPYPVVEAVAFHHQPERVTQHEFDVLAALAIAHSIVPTDDASTFGDIVPPDPRIDPAYLASVNAPFDWDEAVRRIAETAQSKEDLT
jgi:HD-like signal output (HDOD) protein